ncbi:hypothetical protein SLEP1_g24593 [Rubroshorea leprosula]|uniref:Uncharacterized protein n=1 Tax=Rubroshorea leprosula TaxID=152421 RepID=A0AAV5JTF2_9ROSI|nr:hypothetical protein SLEP1_g24593 [Rubroshorea leprosula]
MHLKVEEYEKSLKFEELESSRVLGQARIGKVRKNPRDRFFCTSAGAQPLILCNPIFPSGSCSHYCHLPSSSLRSSRSRIQRISGAFSGEVSNAGNRVAITGKELATSRSPAADWGEKDIELCFIVNL